MLHAGINSLAIRGGVIHKGFRLQVEQLLRLWTDGPVPHRTECPM